MTLYYYHLNIDGSPIDIEKFKIKYLRKNKIIAFPNVSYQDFQTDETSIFCIFDTFDFDHVDKIKDLIKEFPELAFDLYCENPLNNIRYELKYNGGEIDEITKDYNLHYYQENDGNELFKKICDNLDNLPEWQEYIDETSSIDLEEFLDDKDYNDENLEEIKDCITDACDFMDIINEKLEEKYL